MYRYVRRVPEILPAAFPYARVQRSLRTPEKARAFEAAATGRAEVERQFADACRDKGVTLYLTRVDDWGWPDWLVTEMTVRTALPPMTPRPPVAPISTDTPAA